MRGFRHPARSGTRTGGDELRHKRITRRKAVLTGAAAMSVLTTALLLQHADASQTGKPSRAGQHGMPDLRKGTNVRKSARELHAAARTLADRATMPGTSWAVDPRTRQVLVTADRTVVGKRWDRLEAVVGSLGAGMARIQKSAGEFKTFAAGGDAIFGGGARCSLGFNVTTEDGSPGFLTAGHCTVAAQAWSAEAEGAPIGTVQAATFPGDGDFGLVTYDDAATDAPSVVDTGDGRTTQIVRAADATVGLEVSRMGSTTGLQDGVVTGLDATVNYPEGTVTGLIQTDVCAEPGDSGGPLFTVDDGGTGNAVGLTSGGSGDCTAGGETFFQPVSTALSAVGAEIGDGAGNNGSNSDGAPNRD
ncbi:S1 family peptidase [Streptomyces sp. NPDC005901]|uniref:S1 family peptidase n=1 Tax=Streptomyces sp. NPDC005901 TaxID=3157171 RepID=UPI00340E4538